MRSRSCSVGCGKVREAGYHRLIAPASTASKRKQPLMESVVGQCVTNPAKGESGGMRPFELVSQVESRFTPRLSTIAVPANPDTFQSQRHSCTHQGRSTRSCSCTGEDGIFSSSTCFL